MSKLALLPLALNDNMLHTLRFADAQILIAQDYDYMNCMTRKPIEEYAKWELEMNLSKTEYMCTGGNNRMEYLTTQWLQICWNKTLT